MRIIDLLLIVNTSTDFLTGKKIKLNLHIFCGVGLTKIIEARSFNNVFHERLLEV